MNNLSPQNLVLLFVSLVNLGMSIFMVTRGIKNKVNLYFSLMTLANFFWAASLFFFNLSTSPEMLRFFASLPYAFSFLVIVFLFYFTINFPYQIFVLSAIYKWLLNFVVIIVVFYTTFFYKLFVVQAIIKPSHMANYNLADYCAYTVLLALLMLAALGFLFYKYRLAEGIFRWQLAMVLWGVILGIVFGSYFNLFLIYGDNFNYIHLGPLFTLFINFIVLGFIVMPKDKINN